MVLAGSINKQIVGSINAEGGRAVGLCGKDGNMVIARKVHARMRPGEDVVDLGFVGEPDKVDATVLEQMLGRELIPVLAPVAQGPTARPTTSTPTRSPARSPARSGASACCS